MDLKKDRRIVLTLDAGGTNFRFSAIRGGEPLTEIVAMPSNGDNLDKCLENIVQGFTRIKKQCFEAPAAISFAFPGPADYPKGIVGDLGNLPGFRGGVALGPMLEEIFGIPTYINNDGDLFAYGEAICGFLPYVNGLLENAGSPKRYRNLVGVTLGTGFGGGIVIDGRLLMGDNSIAGEVWLLRNKMNPNMNAEEGASIRAIRRSYSEKAGIPMDEAPEPKEIFDIGMGRKTGDADAAIGAFSRLGEVAGDAMANVLTLIDGLGVIGGGISAAWPLFLPTIVKELNGSYIGHDGKRIRRLAPAAFNLEDPIQMKEFIKGKTREISIPGSWRKTVYDPLQRIGIGISRLGTTEAVGVGAYAFALRKLDAD